MLSGMKSEAAFTTLCGSTTSLAWICTLYHCGPPPAPTKAALRACTNMTLTSEQCIPSMVMQIKIIKGTVAIFIVVEHMNIGTTLATIREDLPNAIIIMVNIPSMSDVPGAELPPHHTYGC